MKRIISANLHLILFGFVVMLGSCKAQKMTSDQLMTQNYEITQMGNRDISDSKLTLKVNPENSTISGFSGCNNYTYSYKLDNKILDLGYARATKMYCDDSMELENLFFQKMASVTQFENSKEALHLKNKQGEIVIKAKKKD